MDSKNMDIQKNRADVMSKIGESMDEILEDYLKPVETYWQPSDLLPDASNEEFKDEIDEIQALSKEMNYDLLVVLVGDMITEEALPTYESWLMRIESISGEYNSPWNKWIRGWTAEENRHGDLLNKYLYLTGRVNMKEIEITTHYLLSDGVDIGTDTDPYKNFIYTSFQEIATNVSHRRVASQVKATGNKLLAKMCGIIAADEARHAKAYKEFVRRIFAVDPSEMMLAFEAMMRHKIVMPSVLIRQSGQEAGDLFDHFSDTAQRQGIYTSQDYIDILDSLLEDWDIENIRGLNERAQKARDYLMALPDRLQRISKRLKVPQQSYKFKWVD